jgi:UDP-N-acetylmuramate dehydrogenase
VRKGFALPGSGAGISTKHSLAITNRGTASADDVLQLAKYVQSMVQSTFGVLLLPEPTLVGLSL